MLLANHVGRAAGAAVRARWRRCGLAPASRPGWRRCRAWPPPGPFDVALLRLPKARDEQEMAAHACLGSLREGGRLIVYGGNDEGIRPAAGMLEAARRRGRDAGRARPRPGACRAPSGRHDDAARDFVGMAYRCIARDRRRCALLGLLPRRVRRRPRRRGYGAPARGPAAAVRPASACSTTAAARASSAPRRWPASRASRSISWTTMPWPGGRARERAGRRASSSAAGLAGAGRRT